MRERLKGTLARERAFFSGISAKSGFGETDAPPPPPSGPEPEDALTQRIRALPQGGRQWTSCPGAARSRRPGPPGMDGPSAPRLVGDGADGSSAPTEIR